MFCLPRLKRFPHQFHSKFASSKVFQMTLGSLHLNCIANAERIQMLTHLTTVGEFGVYSSLVYLDNKGYFSRCFVASDGRIAPLVSLPRFILKPQRNMLPNRQAKL